MSRIRWAMWAALSLLAAAPALADPATTAAGDTPPQILRRPTLDEIYSFTSAEALRRGLGGAAVIRCRITLQGTATECQVISEYPPGVGFGDAAIAASRQFTFRPAVHDGAPVSSLVNLPMRFERPAMGIDTHIGGQTGYFVDRVYSDVAWTAAPSLAQMAAAYPQRARRDHIGGAALLECHIVGGGRLEDCQVTGEAPRELGFGAAARALAHEFRAPARADDGQPTAGAYAHLRITFPAELIDHPSPAVGHPHWAQLPNGDTPGSEYPRAAVAANVASGMVMLACTIGADGHLSGCVAAEETPPGYGFAEAALTLSAGFVMPLWTEEGLPTVGASVRVPVRYQLPPSEAAQPPPGTQSH